MFLLVLKHYKYQSDTQPLESELERHLCLYTHKDLIKKLDFSAL